VTSLITDLELPKREEIWLLNFDPTLGSEIQKIRPAVVISSDSIGKLPIKLVAPITDWKPYFSNNIWLIKIEPNTTNNLNKASAIDALQLRGVDLQRFIRKIGIISDIEMSEISIAIISIIEAEI
jgi:mRNA interferase MazF